MSFFHNVKAARIAFQESELEAMDRRASVLHNELAAARLVLARAQHTVDSIAQDLSGLESRQTDARSRLDDMRAEMSPEVMAALPDDVLRMIFFSLAAQIDDGLAVWRRAGRKHYDDGRALLPFDLSAVCRRWRAVALASPSFWGSYLALDSYFESAQECRALQAYTNLIIRRSGSAPLNIVIDWEHLEDEQWATHRVMLGTILFSMIKEAKRWKSIYAKFRTAAAGAQVLTMFRHATPLLEKVEVYTSAEESPNPWRENFPAYLPYCHKLRELSTDVSHVVWRPSLQTPLSVTKLELINVVIPSQTLWHTLASCPLLIHLAIGVHATEFIWRPSAELNLPTLRELELTDDGDALLASWAQSLKLPRLDTLEIRRVHRSHLDVLLPHIAATLSVLKVTSVPILGADELDCLSRITGLTRVELSICGGSRLSAEFFERWTERQAWPRVEEIIFPRWTRFSDDGAEALLKLIRGRSTELSPESEVRRLTHVEIQGPSIPSWLQEQVSLLVVGPPSM
ncbi:hypothetical protein EXIGLDRAFT_718168 [Exidia glandulosa HHB12029]|uniref:Uncharacterized protein n=1 Tax=Exidia glandulosa HHB12029 TaxID=1314781 RepID=A0A166AJW0_EXIGL|nr:hypothetical protein EXIGLDRAFT_718168 [Exidia glandulosa HHB12029]